jgi:hypothetical protein
MTTIYDGVPQSASKALKMTIDNHQIWIVKTKKMEYCIISIQIVSVSIVFSTPYVGSGACFSME